MVLVQACTIWYALAIIITVDVGTYAMSPCILFGWVLPSILLWVDLSHCHRQAKRIFELVNK